MEIAMMETPYNEKKDTCISRAKLLIDATDWAMLPDIYIENKNDFIVYRSILRNLILNPVEDPIFPTEPEPIWIEET